MSQSKTDKIRERLSKMYERGKYVASGIDNGPEFDVINRDHPKLIEALEAVVEELEHSVQITDEGEPAVLFAGELLDIIANELDVEEK